MFIEFMLLLLYRTIIYIFISISISISITISISISMMVQIVVIAKSIDIQGFPQRMRLQRRLYGI